MLYSLQTVAEMEEGEAVFCGGFQACIWLRSHNHCTEVDIKDKERNQASWRTDFEGQIRHIFTQMFCYILKYTCNSLITLAKLELESQRSLKYIMVSF